MISVEKAVQIVLDSINVLEPVTVPILGSMGRVLGEDIISAENFPAFDQAGISGYAVRAEDIAEASANNPITLTLDGEIVSGLPFDKVLTPKHAVRVSAGSVIPQDADCILSEEHTVRQSNKKLLVYRSVPKGEFIRYKGEDISKDTLVLPKGKKINAHDIGALSAIGITEVNCFRQPRVSFLSSGNGLVDINGSLSAGKQRAANRYALFSQLSEYGAEPVDLGIAKNDREQVQVKIIEGLEHDMFVSTVGPSHDDFSYMKKMLEQLGMDIKFWRVAIKPAKPFIFGICGGIPVFGLSDNLGAGFVVMEQFIRPALMKMMGSSIIKRLEVKAVLTKDLRAEPGVTCFIRGTVTTCDTGFQVTPELRRNNSVKSNSANGLIVIPEDAGYLPTGSKVTVQVISGLIAEN